MIFRIVLASTLLIAKATYADTISGKVIAIADGDTLTILDSRNTQTKVRLAAIDAPEKAQAFGNKSKQSLSEICFGKSASVEVLDIDRYKRWVGVVSCDGVRANDEQVKLGMAWVYREYANGFSHLYKLEDEARQEKRGLWSDPSPTPPWEWRKAKRP